MRAEVTELELLVSVAAFSLLLMMAEGMVVAGGRMASGGAAGISSNLYRMAELQKLLWYRYAANGSGMTVRSAAIAAGALIEEYNGSPAGYGERMTELGGKIYLIGWER